VSHRAAQLALVTACDGVYMRLGLAVPHVFRDGVRPFKAVNAIRLLALLCRMLSPEPLVGDVPGWMSARWHQGVDLLHEKFGGVPGAEALSREEVHDACLVLYPFARLRAGQQPPPAGATLAVVLQRYETPCLLWQFPTCIQATLDAKREGGWLASDQYLKTTHPGCGERRGVFVHMWLLSLLYGDERCLPLAPPAAAAAAAAGSSSSSAVSASSSARAVSAGARTRAAAAAAAAAVDTTTCDGDTPGDTRARATQQTVVMHICNNRRCCNLWHLVRGTRSQNRRNDAELYKQAWDAQLDVSCAAGMPGGLAVPW